MKGKYSILVQNNRLRYEFTIFRNITIIRGDSATGKTTLLDLLAAYYRDGEGSGVIVRCEVPCVVIGGQHWRESLAPIHGSIVFIDECNSFVKSEDFAVSVKESDNYFVIVTRDDLPNLPYSVNEIYGIRKSNKYAGLKQVYNELYQVYGSFEQVETDGVNLLLAEDYNAGYEFFRGVYSQHYTCLSANGKSNIFKILQQHHKEKVLVVADGAAFGCEMAKIMQLMRLGRRIVLYLPESFEWLVLRSGVIEDSEIKAILEEPCQFIDSKAFFSWERFFTSLLIQKSKDTYLHYNKKSLNKVYLKEKVKDKIMELVPIKE